MLESAGRGLNRPYVSHEVTRRAFRRASNGLHDPGDTADIVNHTSHVGHLVKLTCRQTGPYASHSIGNLDDVQPVFSLIARHETSRPDITTFCEPNDVHRRLPNDSRRYSRSARISSAEARPP